MKITREQLKGIVREAMIEENEYQEFFKKALEKAGKSIPQMSDEEKKAFFNKIETTWKGRGEKKESVVQEAMRPSQIRSAISKVKKQLMRKWKQKGGYENFGQKELSQMKDKFDYNPYGSPDERTISKMLDGFDNWAMNYDGNMRESVEEAQSPAQKAAFQKMLDKKKGKDDDKKKEEKK